MKYLIGFFTLVLLVPQVLFAANNFGIKPAYPREDNPRTESIFVHSIKPGESVRDGVKVVNGMDIEKRVYVYATDSARSSGGAFACGQLSNKREGVGSWIDFDLSEIDEETRKVVFEKDNGFEIILPPGTEIDIPFAVSLPSNVSVGEHNGCIVIQEVKAKSDQAGVNLTVRSGIRVAITVPGEVKRELKFVGFTVNKNKQKVSLKTLVENTGNVSIDTDVSVDVKHFFGLNFREFGGSYPVLRGETSEFNFEMKNPLLGGIFFTKAIFSYDADSRAVIGVNTDSKLVKVKSDTFWFVLPPRGLGFVIWALILFIIWFIWNFIKFKKEQRRHIESWPDYVVKDGDTLQTISKEFRLPWKFIVKANRLKPPFMLEPGQKIKLPPRKKK